MTSEELIQAARAAAGHAHAPYSSFAVGAAVLLIDGSVVTGAGVERVAREAAAVYAEQMRSLGIDEQEAVRLVRRAFG